MENKVCKVINNNDDELSTLKYDINLEGKTVKHVRFYLSGYSQIEFEGSTYYLPSRLLKFE